VNKDVYIGLYQYCNASLHTSEL